MRGFPIDGTISQEELKTIDPPRESFLNDIELNGFFRDLNSYNDIELNGFFRDLNSYLSSSEKALSGYDF